MKHTQPKKILKHLSCLPRRLKNFFLSNVSSKHMEPTYLSSVDPDVASDNEVSSVAVGEHVEKGRLARAAEGGCIDRFSFFVLFFIH